MIYLGSDHAAVDLKDRVKKFLDKQGIAYKDLGSHDKDSHDDYPDYAFKVAKKVASEKASKGILMCGTGTGMVIAANKVKGIRAAVAYDEYSAMMGRNDNDINILCLRGRKFSPNKAIKTVDKWLNTPFSKEPRHERRIKKIEEYERKR